MGFAATARSRAARYATSRVVSPPFASAAIWSARASMCARSWAGAALPIACARSMAVLARAGWFSSVRATLNPTWAIASVASILSAWLNERAASTQRYECR